MEQWFIIVGNAAAGAGDLAGSRKMLMFKCWQVKLHSLLRQRGRSVWVPDPAQLLAINTQVKPLHSALGLNLTMDKVLQLPLEVAVLHNIKMYSRLPVLCWSRSGSAMFAPKWEQLSLSPIRNSLKAPQRSQATQTGVVELFAVIIGD